MRFVIDFMNRKKGLGDDHKQPETCQRELVEPQVIKTIPAAKTETRKSFILITVAFVLGFILGLAAFYTGSHLSRGLDIASGFISLCPLKPENNTQPRNTFARSDMPFEMQHNALAVIKKALSLHPNNESQVAHFIKTEFDKTHNEQWQCFVGNSSKIDISLLADHFINVKLDNVEVLLFHPKIEEVPQNLTIYDVEMSNKMQNDAIALATAAIDKGMSDDDIACLLREKFDKWYRSKWQCIVGTNFTFNVHHWNNRFIHFKIRHISILLFKGGFSLF